MSNDNDNDNDKAAEAREGMFDSIAGKAKEVAGAVTGKDELVEEGQLQQAEASTRKEALADEAIADAIQLARPLPFVCHVAQQPPGEKEFHEPVHVRVLLDQRPVEPVGLGVVAVEVVVPALGPADLVAHEDHGHAQGQEGGGQGRRAKMVHAGIVRRASRRSQRALRNRGCG